MQTKEQRISPIKQRILEFAGTLRISKREFYAKIGVSRGTLESKTGVTEDVMAKFIAKYPEVNIEWLVTGEGQMKTKCINSNSTTSCRQKIVGKDNELYYNYKNEGEKSLNEEEGSSSLDERSDSSIPVATHASEPGEGIPLLPIDAMAGALTSEQTVLEYECERYVVPVFSGADFLIPVNGTSMVPTYHPGDIVACKRVPMSGLFFQWGKIYVIDTTQGPLIKRIKPSADPQHITIVSDNTAFDPFQLPTADIRAVALVIGVIRLE